MNDHAANSQPSASVFPTFYAACVAGMTVFVACTLLFPEPIQLYRVKAVVVQQAAASAAPLDLPLLRAGEIERIARLTFAEVLPSADRTPGGFQAAVSVATETPTPTELHVVLETRNRYADRALHLAEAISAALVKEQPGSLVPGWESLQSQRSDVQRRLALVRENRQHLENEIRSLEREHLLALSSSVQRVTSLAQTLPLPAAQTEYSSLEAELQELLVTRRELTSSLTSQHPRVIAIDEQLAELKARFERSGTTLQASMRSSTSVTSAQQNSLNEITVLNETFRRRTLETSHALAAARVREESLLSEDAQLAIAPASVGVQTTVLTAPRVVERVGGRPSLWRLSFFAVLAFSAAAGVYTLANHHSARRHLRTTDDVWQQLGVPVVSLVGCQEEGTASSPLERMLRRGVLVAEIVLLILALTTFSLVSTQSQLARPVAVDPLGAVAESLDRTLTATLRR